MAGNRAKGGGRSGRRYVLGHVHDGRVTQGAVEKRNVEVFCSLDVGGGLSCVRHQNMAHWIVQQVKGLF